MEEYNTVVVIEKGGEVLLISAFILPSIVVGLVAAAIGNIWLLVGAHLFLLVGLAIVFGKNRRTRPYGWVAPPKL